MPALPAPYAPMNRNESRPACEEMPTYEPRPESARCGALCFRVRNAPMMLRSRVARTASTSARTIGPR